jgi:M6 family metalloprotease-like protein
MADPRMSELPAPTLNNGIVEPGWNSVALFFNLDGSLQPTSYQHTTVDHVLDWIDEGPDACSPDISRFISSYWYLMSKGQFACGMDVARDGGAPIVAEVELEDGKDSGSWPDIIKAIVAQHAHAIWDAAGNREVEGKRWIPSVVLIQHYDALATAWFGGWEQAVGGKTYLIGDATHVPYKLTKVTAPNGTILGRETWSLICHEMSHNFLEQDDLYGPSGSTGYWDILGDNLLAGRMPESSSYFKQKLGWLQYKHVVEGPFSSKQRFTLAPYTTSLEAIKIVPDPHHTPDEFFILEYRKKTGDESWRPDVHLGAEEGLLIYHFKTRMGLGGIPWTLREAPFMDIEKADFKDRGTTLRLWSDDLTGVLYPHAGNDSFTPFSSPNSDLYGERGSGLSITDIRIDPDHDELSFDVKIRGIHTVGWFTQESARYIAGRFTPEAATRGRELFAVSDRSAALLLPRQAQWVVAQRQLYNLGSWSLGGDQRGFVADLDGDGADEVFLRTDTKGTVLKWRAGGFSPIDSHLSTWWIDGTSSEHRFKVLPGDRDSIVSHKGDAIALLEYAGGELVPFAEATGFIGQFWQIDAEDQVHVGRFTQPDHDEILLVADGSVGIFTWDEENRSIKAVVTHNGIIDGWQIGPGHTYRVADLDGDGRHEVYVRAGSKAAILKYQGTPWGLHVVFECADEVPHKDAPGNDYKLALTSGDESHAGRFYPDRDLILHRNDKSLHLLRWDDGAGALVVDKYYNNGWHPKFTLHADDRIVIGDFHPVGDDPNKDQLGGEVDYIGEGLEDVFLSNKDETKMIGPNYVRPKPGKKLHEEFAPFWHCDGEFMMQIAGSDVRSVVTVREDDEGRNLTFLDELTGTFMDVDQFCSAIELGLYPEYHIRVVNDRRVPASNPNSLVSDNLDRD